MIYRGIKNILTKFREMLLEDEYRVGRPYFTFDKDDDPNDHLPGTWERLPDGVFIRNAGGNAGTVGSIQGESLPNITGKWSASELTERVADVFSEGALYNAGTHPTSNWNANGSNDGRPALIGFDASRSNTIYKGSHVTPVNVALYMWRRIS